MTQFYDALKALINPELISRASTLLDEREAGISKAVTSIISSFLGVMLKRGNTPQIRETLEEAGRLNILAEIKSLWENDLTHDQQRLGDNLLQQLLGDKAADFSDPIAAYAGISKPATNKLVSMISPVVAGFLGNKLVKENYSLHTLLREIDKEKNQFVSNIPADLIKSFGLASVLNTNTNAAATPVEEKKKGGFGWVAWVILAIVLLLLFLWWRSCRNNDVQETVYSENVVTSDSINQGIVTPVSNTSMNEEREMQELTLPDGVRLQAYRGGVEDQMVNFLKSDDYKNADDKELQDHWFQFDNVAFEFNSSTELTPESETQLDNIVAILKYYKDAKIKIGGFADKVGTEQANMEISRERAKTIEAMLERRGLGAQVVKTEGFGDEYAKHSASASNEERESDRDIALRFVKM